MSTAERKRVQRGDVQVDKDGSRWIVTSTEHDGPHVRVGRVREGSFAARMIFGRPNRSSSS